MQFEIVERSPRVLPQVAPTSCPRVPTYLSCKSHPRVLRGIRVFMVMTSGPLNANNVSNYSKEIEKDGISLHVHWRWKPLPANQQEKLVVQPLNRLYSRLAARAHATPHSRLTCLSRRRLGYRWFARMSGAVGNVSFVDPSGESSTCPPYRNDRPARRRLSCCLHFALSPLEVRTMLIRIQIARRLPDDARCHNPRIR